MSQEDEMIRDCSSDYEEKVQANASTKPLTFIWPDWTKQVKQYVFHKVSVVSAAALLAIGSSFLPAQQDVTNLHRDLLERKEIIPKQYELLEQSIKIIEQRITTPPAGIDTLKIPTGQFAIEINKEEQLLRVWKRVRYVLVAEELCSTGINKGDKKKYGDGKTPEGLTKIVSEENSEKWLFENKVGAYGKSFYRLDFGRWNKKGDYFPDQKSPIGIHGTNEPEYLGTRRSHGCIRIDNQFLTFAGEKKYVAKGNYVLVTKDHVIQNDFERNYPTTDNTTYEARSH